MRKSFTLISIWNYIVKVVSARFVAFIILLIIFMIFLIPVFCHYFNCLSFFSDASVLISFYSLLLATILAIVALIIYHRSTKDEEANFLTLSLVTEQKNNVVKICTGVNNSTKFDREVYFAFIMITQSGDFLKNANEKLRTSFECTNNLSNLRYFNKITQDDFAFIPLPYYFSENVRVGNESLSYDKLIKVDEGNKEFEVRFFVYRNSKDVNNLHRCVCSSFKGDSIHELEQYVEQQTNNTLPSDPANNTKQ